MLDRYEQKIWNGFGIGLEPMSSSYELGNGILGPIKCGEFFDLIVYLLAFWEGLYSMQVVVWSVGRPMLGGFVGGFSILKETCLSFVKKNFV